MKTKTYKDAWQMLISLSQYMMLNKHNHTYIKISDNPFITIENVYGYTTYCNANNMSGEPDCLWSIQKKDIKGKGAKYFFSKNYRSVWLNNMELFANDPKKFDKHIDVYLVHKS